MSNTKNAEVKVFINGSDTAVTVLIPIDKSKMSCIQSIKSKAKTNIIVEAVVNKNMDKAKAIVDGIASKWHELIEPELKKALPGISCVYTEANNLMTFEYGTGETYTAMFELK